MGLPLFFAVVLIGEVGADNYHNSPRDVIVFHIDLYNYPALQGFLFFWERSCRIKG